MKASFHYKLKVNLIRYQTRDDINFITFEKEFKNESPIIARKEAFDEYREWINDLYSGMGKNGKYVNDKQARIDLRQFILSKKVTINGEYYILNDPLEYGIGIYFIVDEPYNDLLFLHKISLPEEYYPLDHIGDEILIHGIGNAFHYNDPLEISYALNQEFVYYEHYGYNKGGYERLYNFYDPEINDVDIIHILETPFDWGELDKNSDIVVEKDDYNNETDKLRGIIMGGEGNQVEFKPALLYNFYTSKGGISIKQIIATAICAFMNSNGGLLFIGLNDDGSVQGLDYDFSLSERKNPKDYFLLEIDSLISYFFDFTVKPYIEGKFYHIDENTIFVFKIHPSKTHPIFLKNQGKKEFFVRGFAGNRLIKDDNEVKSYWNNRSMAKDL